MRTPTVLKCELEKIQMQIYKNHTSAWVLPGKFTACLQNTPFEEYVSGNAFDV